MHEHEIINLLRTIAVNGVNAGYPAEIAYGEVVSMNPIRIKFDEKLILDEDFLAFTETSRRRPEAAADGTIRFADLKAGDQVIAVRVQGGQEYVVLDRRV